MPTQVQVQAISQVRCQIIVWSNGVLSGEVEEEEYRTIGKSEEGETASTFVSYAHSGKSAQGKLTTSSSQERKAENSY